MDVIEGVGLLRDPLAAVKAVLAANTRTLPETGDTVVMSNEAFSEPGGWHLGNWETFLTALGTAYVDPPLALSTLRAALRLLADGGILGMAATPDGPLSALSNPPIAAYCVWQVFQLTGERDLLEAFPLLLRWHNWWPNFRDGNHNKLLNWASPAETGMPTHPLYADAAVDPQTGVLALDDVGLTALWALDAFALMRMALALDDLDHATHLENEILNVTELMNLTFWDPDRGIYRSQDWAGLPVESRTLTALLTLIGRIPTGQRLPRLLDEHLAMEFSTPFMLPTLGRGDDAYDDQQPWRGRVSPLLNYLIAAGLRYFQADDWAERVSLSGLALLKKSWANGQVFASYHAGTGAGDDITQDAQAPLGTLLGVLGVQMLLDVEPWDGMRLGNLAGADMMVVDLPLLGDRYTVSSGAWGLKAQRNDRPWLSVDRPAIIRNLSQTEREVSLQLRVAATQGRVTLHVHGFHPGQQVTMKVNGSLTKSSADHHGTVERTLALPLPTPGVAGRAAA